MRDKNYVYRDMFEPEMNQEELERIRIDKLRKIRESKLRELLNS